MLFRSLAVTLTSVVAAPAADDTWNLADIYPSNEAWDAACGRLESRFASLEGFRGQLGESASVLAAALENSFDVRRELLRTYAYASMLSDQDTREAKPREMDQQGSRLQARFAEATAFIEPEILALGRDVVDAFLADEPRLEPYRHYLDDILRRAPHTLDTRGEELVAATLSMSDAASSLSWPTPTSCGRR
jgi:oligoendopeptidase F